MAKANYQSSGRPGNDELLFLPLGGCNEIGMNLNLYGHAGKWLMVDLGVTFNDGSLSGVDVITPDPTFIEENIDDLAGLVVTHAHEDHLGAIPYLWRELRCPIYATPFTAAFLKRKLVETKLDDIVPIHIIPLGGQVKIAGFDVEFVTLSHSIPEPSGLVIRTKAGNIFHTGDWKIDYDADVNGEIDKQKMAKIGTDDILAMVCDSTNVLVPGHSQSESVIATGLKQAIGNFHQGLAVTCFASNIARLRAVVEAGLANGRKPVLVGRSLWRMNEAARECGYLNDFDPFLTDKDAAKLPKSQLLYICTGSQGEPRAALARIARDDHPSVRLGDGDAVIFSSRDIPGNEIAIGKLQNNLARLGVEVVTADEYEIHASGHPCRDELMQMYEWIRPHILVPVHGEPRHLIAHANLARSCQIPHSLQPHNGMLISLTRDGPQVLDDIYTGRLALHGGELLPCNDISLKERGKLAENGAVFISLQLDRKGLPSFAPQISVVGLPELEDDERGALLDEIDDCFAPSPKKASRANGKSGGKNGGKNGGRHHEYDLPVEERVRRAARRYFYGRLSKKPMVAVHVN